MLYSDLGFWLAQQPVEVQIIAIYLMGLTTMVLLVLDCWYDYCSCLLLSSQVYSFPIS